MESQRQSAKATLRAPEWEGEELQGRTIIIFGEQGRGDIIQFARYAPLLIQRGATVVFGVPAPFIRLFRHLEPDIKLTGSVVDEQSDFQCALMSLPLRFATDFDSIPNATPYLKAEPDLVAKWKERIGEHGFKIGIAWQGDPKSKIDQGRSIPVAEFVRLSDLPGVRLISSLLGHIRRIFRRGDGTIQSNSASRDDGCRRRG